MSVLEISERGGGVRLLTLHRPRANAFNLELMRALSLAIRAATDDPEVRALVLTGAGDLFSAGLDVKALMAAQGGGAAAVAEFAAGMTEAFTAVWTCPKPTVAAVNGHAIAAGYLVAVACDFRYAVASGARYGLNELAWGAAFPAVAIELARLAMGSAAQRFIQDGELFDGLTGAANGSFHGVADAPAAVLGRALAQATKLAARPLAGYAHAKALLLAPSLAQVAAEGPEDRARGTAITASPETAAALVALLTRRGA